jgi:Rad3-related DNA helicase
MNRVSVRGLVEFIMKSGSIDARFAESSHTAQEGSRIHRKLQDELADEYEEKYSSEVDMKKVIILDGRELLVHGRADGVITLDDETIIDEIKTSEPDFEDMPKEQIDLFWYQVMVYGYFYCLDEELDKITLQLTYYQTTEEKITRTQKHFSFAELEQFFNDLIQKYEQWIIYSEEWRDTRNASARALKFPYGSFRRGQRELSSAVYNTIRQQKKLYVEAPTGTGKTISTMFPTIKAMGEELEGEALERIFYMTAKTITRTVAEESFRDMHDAGLKLKSTTLTSKDKICFLEERNCTPEACPFANGYFNRVNDTLWDMLHEEDDMSRGTIEKYARKHEVCPFELSLDASQWSDLVIMDYNYLFDPRVYLRRFFEDEDKSNFFLVDEAHNLVDRARSMYSAELSKENLMRIKRLMKGEKSMSRRLEAINKEFLKIKKTLEESETTFISQKSEVSSMIRPLERFNEYTREWLAKNQEHEHQKEVLEYFFEVLGYLRIAEYYDDHFVTYVQKTYTDITIKIYCVDPTYVLNRTLNKGRGAVLFSATFTPLDYFQDILGGVEGDFKYLIPTPFEKEKQAVIVDRSISTTYHNREKSLEPIAKRLTTFIKARTGNYMFFFPSYRYMDDVYREFTDINPDVQVLLQGTSMTEEERLEFLANFKDNPDETLWHFVCLVVFFQRALT